MFFTAIDASALSPPAVPDDSVYTGVGARPGQLPDYVAASGKYPALRLTFYDWNASFPADPVKEESVTNISANGMIPVVTWEPNGVLLGSIVNGSRDAYIRSWAQGARDAGTPIFLRYAHEMNGNYYTWCQARTPANNVSLYVQSWRHIHDIFQEEGADNVAFVWSPMWESKYPVKVMDYYPGDEYVDWVGIDMYSWPDWPRDPALMMSELYGIFEGRKPIMIAETGAAPAYSADVQYSANPYYSNKTRYIQRLFQCVDTDFREVKAVIWFNLDKEYVDWRISTSYDSMMAYRQAISSGRYIGAPYGSAGDFDCKLEILRIATSPYPKVENYTFIGGNEGQVRIRVENAGGLPDKYFAFVEGMPASWGAKVTLDDHNSPVGRNASLFGGISFRPDAPGSYPVTIVIRSANGAYAAQSTVINVAGDFSTLPAPSPEPVSGVYLMRKDAYYNGKSMSMENVLMRPGETVTQAVAVYNTGSVNATYRIEVSGLPERFIKMDIGGKVTNQTRAVSPGEYVTGVLTIKPDMAGDYAYTVTATSDSGESASRTYDLKVAYLEASSPPDPTPAPGSILYDDFDSFNTSLWTKSIYGGPHETQFLAQNVYLLPADDALVLVSNATDHTGGEVYSNVPYGFGKYRASMKLDLPQGVTEAFFTYRTPYPEEHNEIDVEFVREGGVVYLYFVTWVQGLQNYSRYALPFDPGAGYHEYGFDWRSDRVDFYVDGAKLFTSYERIPQSLSYLLFNNWVRSDVEPMPGATTGRLYVDWVYIEPFEAVPTPTPTPAPDAVDVIKGPAILKKDRQVLDPEDMTVKKGEGISITFSIKNNGAVTDTYLVYITNIPEYWYDGSRLGNVTVKPGRMVNRTITVRALNRTNYSFYIVAKSTTGDAIDSEAYSITVLPNKVPKVPVPPAGILPEPSPKPSLEPAYKPY